MFAPRVTLPLLLALTLPVQAKPLTVPNDAWRQSTLQDLVPLLRACLPKSDATALARLPVAKDVKPDIETTIKLQEPADIGSGYWYRIGWRPSDGAVFIVAARSPDGQRTVLGPVGGDWSCLPAEVRKELGGR